MSKLIEELELRGLIKDCSNLEALTKRMETPITLYCGFDPTGDSLHVGHLLPIIMLKRFQDHGHHPLLIAGGGTGSIGDPGGKSIERPILSFEQIDKNVEGIKKHLSLLLNFEGDNAASIINNADWLKQIDLLAYLRDFGKFFNLNYMLAKDTVSSRLETGISYAEFSYMILQSIDYLELYKKYNCQLQIGGSDQWGNITAGLELIRKKEGDQAEAYALTLPLLVKADGNKFGKSEGGAVWLDENKTSAYDFYQFWLNTSDQDVIGFLKQLTFLPLDKVNSLELELSSEPEKRASQKALAYEMTCMIHGIEKCERAIEMSALLFANQFEKLSVDELKVCFKDIVPTVIEQDTDIITLLIDSGICSSKREARDLIKQGGISVNGHKIADETHVVTKVLAISQKLNVIRKGKKKYHLIEHQ